MTIRSGIRDILGRRIVGVIGSQSQTSLKSQLFLVFEDNTYFELFSVDGHISSGSRLYGGDLNDLKTQQAGREITVCEPANELLQGSGPYLVAHRDDIESRHYVRQATAANYWFDFTSSRIESFVCRYGEDFCLVVNGSLERDDAYVLPYSIARRIFRPECQDTRGRWVGTIIGHQLRVPTCDVSRDVGSFHNAFYLLPA